MKKEKGLPAQAGISTLTGIIIIVVAAVILFGGVFAYQYFLKSQTLITNVQNSNSRNAKCSNLYWFDNLNRCSQEPKQFCGAYMYYGLQTFKTKEECLNGWSISSGRGPIKNQPSIAVTSPNGGEIWKIGETQNIKWISTGLSPTDKIVVKLWLYGTLDNGKYGSPFGVIKSYTLTGPDDDSQPIANSGSYLWTIPFEILPGDKYKIDVVDLSNPKTIMGTFIPIGEGSSSYFTITK